MASLRNGDSSSPSPPPLAVNLNGLKVQGPRNSSTDLLKSVSRKNILIGDPCTLGDLAVRVCCLRSEGVRVGGWWLGTCLNIHLNMP